MALYAVKCEQSKSFYVYVEAESSWDAEAKAEHELAYSFVNWGERDKPACRMHIKEHSVKTIRAVEFGQPEEEEEEAA
jgi:hypothetical protein